MTTLGNILFGIALFGFLSGAVPAAAESDDPVARALARTAQSIDLAGPAVDAAAEPSARLAMLLSAGRADDAYEVARAGLADGSVPDVKAAEALFAVQAFDELDSLVGAWTRHGRTDDPAVRRVLYRWLFTVDDLARLDELTRARVGGGDAVDHLAAGRLALDLLDRDRAESMYRAAGEMAALPPDRAAAQLGLGRVAMKRNDWDLALERILEAHRIAPLDADLLADLAETLIRLGRTDEAITALELAVRTAPYHERAHYLLGNGYARRNYTQLFAAYPNAFAAPESEAALALRGGDERFEAGELAAARSLYSAASPAVAPFADLETRLGSLAFAEGNLPEARTRFLRALAVCPEYGRAHNGLAKTLEMERLRVEVHRGAYEAAFAALTTPDVPGIERFVTNWNALGARHRKMVALAVAPWARYLPVLIEGGQTYTIKPLHQLLSETPGQATLRDQRIDYDSRLWDDVRGCGGFHTVTGIEDVERTILGRYNTVLHELTHQVHGILTAENKRRIQDLYRAAKVREEATGEGFLSRYAGGSVWEYFAEGANSLESPRRDAYDTREIVRERLEAVDPPLRDLVRQLMVDADIESTYAVAFANQGDNRLEYGRPLEAIGHYRRALDRAPREESALGSIVFALLAADSLDAAVAWGETGVERQPESGALAARHAQALWHAGRGLDRAIATAADALTRVRAEDQADLWKAVGRLRGIAGDAEGSAVAYRQARAYQEDDPGALWGLAEAAALSGDWTEAWELFERAVRARTGVVDLRTSFAFHLMRAGEPARAREQVEAALLLDPEDPDALALRGWVELAEGHGEAALASAERALAQAAWCDLALVVKAESERGLGRIADAERTLAPLRARMAANDPPRLIYRENWGRFDEVGTLPATLRALVSREP